jgi:hypothetical protein
MKHSPKYVGKTPYRDKRVIEKVRRSCYKSSERFEAPPACEGEA